MIDFSNMKGQYGLGIMIIEGKHAEVGQGIFISDIQEGSAAEQVITTNFAPTIFRTIVIASRCRLEC